MWRNFTTFTCLHSLTYLDRLFSHSQVFLSISFGLVSMSILFLVTSLLPCSSRVCTVSDSILLYPSLCWYPHLIISLLSLFSLFCNFVLIHFCRHKFAAIVIHYLFYFSSLSNYVLNNTSSYVFILVIPVIISSLNTKFTVFVIKLIRLYAIFSVFSLSYIMY